MPNKFLATFFTIFLGSSLIYAQELNEAFLNSLPANVKEDFVGEMNNKDDSTKNYSNPDTRITNLENALREAEDSLEKIKIELQGASEDSGQLSRFGEKFFNSFQSTFLPINTPNPSDYILDSGDEITLQLVGSKNRVIKGVIKRDGTVNIPEVGNILISGLTIDKALDLIKVTVEEVLTGTSTYMSLSSLRDINVLAVGNIENPGMYTLPGGSTFLSLIDAAGGINDAGSYRDIVHIRNGKEVQKIDLYDIFAKGSFIFSSQLRSGDSLFVRPKLPEVRLSGGFANEGIYEFFPSESINDIFQMAGVTNQFLSSSVLIKSYNGSYVSEKSFELSNLNDLKLNAGDSIRLLSVVPEFNKVKSVKISGEVKIPGSYNVDDNTRLLDLITQAGGYSENAYTKGGVFLRRSAKELEESIKERSYNDIIRYLVSGPNFAQILASPDSKGILTFLSMLKEYEPSGRLVTNFDTKDLEKDIILNRLLEDGDSIHIPSFKNEVYVFGEVMNPGAFPYKELGDASAYIALAGSFTRIADESKIIVIRPDGSSEILKKSFYSLLDNQNDLLLPGSVIFVPNRIAKIDGLNLASAVAPIISSVALSLASLNSINN